LLSSLFAPDRSDDVKPAKPEHVIQREKDADGYIEPEEEQIKQYREPDQPLAFTVLTISSRLNFITLYAENSIQTTISNSANRKNLGNGKSRIT